MIDYRALGRDLFERGYRAGGAEDLKFDFDLTDEEAKEAYKVLMVLEAVEPHWDDITFWMNDNLRQEVYDKFGEDSDKILLFDEFRKRDPDIWEFVESLL